jgi:EmrB/QacA subfamily drug resistance transporter
MASAVSAVSNRNEFWVLVTTVLASGMAFIDATALNVAMPAIQAQWDATAVQLLWILNAYSLVVAALLFFGGALGDRYGRANVFAVGITMFVTASACCGLAWDVVSLIFARAFQGIGAAMMIPGSLALIGCVVDPSRRGRAIGIWTACSVVMTAMGPVIGGIFADKGWWRAIFWINLPIGLLALVTLRTKLSTVIQQRRSESMDCVGAVLAVASLAFLSFGMIEVARRGWSDRIVVVSLLVALGAGIALVWHELRSNSPLIPLALFRDRRFTAACQMTLCFYSTLYGMLFFLSLNLIQVQGYSALETGIAQVPVMLFVILLSPLAGKLVDRYGPRVPLVVGGLVASTGFLLLSRAGLPVGSSGYWTQFFPPLLLLGAAMGMTAAPLSTTIINSVPSCHLGIASGINSTLSRLSGVLGIAMLGPLAITTFRRAMIDEAKSSDLSAGLTVAIERESHKLANAIPPAGLAPELSELFENLVRVAYIDSFRVISLMSAAAVAVSTLVAAGMLTQHSEN